MVQIFSHFFIGLLLPNVMQNPLVNEFGIILIHMEISFEPQSHP